MNISLTTKIANRLYGVTLQNIISCVKLFLERRDILSYDLLCNSLVIFFCGSKKVNLCDVAFKYIDKQYNNNILTIDKYKFYYTDKIHSLFAAECLDVFVHFLNPEYWDPISNALAEGPYESSNVKLHNGDIIIDAGANIGIFSIPAAINYTNSIVYAFEPQPAAYKILSKNIQFNSLESRINIVKYALSDKTCTVDFLEEQDWIGGSGFTSCRPATQMKGIIYRVNCTSLDKWVEANHIKRIDFIKADIEGAERLLLAGAKGVMRKFKPRLAICTYHLQDDKTVLEQLIKDANPEYHIEQHKKKLLAW